MSEPIQKPASAGPARPITAVRSANSSGTGPSSCSADAMLCERCGVAMYRMHAVWRCPGCGFKTDCCGW